MKASLIFLLSIPLSAYAAAVDSAAECASSNACLAKVSANLQKHHACGQYKPKTVTPKPTTKTVHTKVTGQTFTETTTVVVRTVTRTATKSKTTFVSTVTVTQTPDTSRLNERAMTTLKPLPVPAFATSVCKGYSQYSSACSCLGHTRTLITAARPTVTSTVTRTSGTTVTSTVSSTKTKKTTSTTTISATKTVTETQTDEPTPGCGLEGLQFANYANNQGSNDDETYSQFDPTVYKTVTPRDNGVTYNVAEFYAGPTGTISFYDGYEIDIEYFVLDHKAYIHAPKTGVYTIYLAADDIALGWAGANAYSGWTRANADIVATINAPPDPVTVNLVKGDYYPFRVMLANAASYSGLNLTITQPDGSVLLDGSSNENESIVQQSCDGITAPPFEDWADES